VIRPIIALLAVAVCPTSELVLEGHLCPGSDIRWYFTETDCDEPVVITGCGNPIPEDPDNFASPPTIDPDFDEYSPTGPGPGPPGATTVDKP
jgi:hypothetical protein